MAPLGSVLGESDRAYIQTLQAAALMADDVESELSPWLTAGMACAALIADPASWVNRRVETVELLSHEETRRRVSIDFGLSDEQLGDLGTAEGIVVPISVLTKEPRRNFDLRDESNRAVPVLGKQQNGDLAHTAVMYAVVEALGDDLTSEVFEMLSADLRQVVATSPPAAEKALGAFVGSAEAGDRWRGGVWADETCRSLLSTLWSNYVLFAVLAPGGPSRRILKYSYGEDFDFKRATEGIAERLAPGELAWRAWRPDRRRFIVECPGAWRATSFHVEIAIPEELRVDVAVLYDFAAEEHISDADNNVNRASLYAHRRIDPDSNVAAALEVAPERAGTIFQAAATSVIIATLLWLGVGSQLDATNPGPAVSILLAGAALFSGVAAARGEHTLTKKVFTAPRLCLFLATLAALAGSATLAMEIPDHDPVELWRVAAILATIAAGRLMWSALRAPG